MKIIYLILFSLLSLNAFGEVPLNDPKKLEKEVRVDKNVHRMRMYLTTDFTTISSPAEGGAALAGIGLSLQGMYAISDRFAASLGTWQSFSFSGSSVITSFDGRLTYALTGKLISTDVNTIIDNTRVATVTDYDTSGFRLQLLRVQYYFNASANTVPYSGNGFSAYYEYVSHSRVSYTFGGRMDMIANSDFSATPLQFFFGIGTPF